ncbi:hypothetical protein ACTGJ9_034950 [Bradyrhizobium sp. RDM12]
MGIPILDNKNSAAASVFEAGALLREARRQKQLEFKSVPDVCALDPDGDIVRRLKRDGRARRAEDWPCHHTDLYTFDLNGGRRVGIAGRNYGDGAFNSAKPIHWNAASNIWKRSFHQQ